jgi:fatty-acyl-CoA synthase
MSGVRYEKTREIVYPTSCATATDPDRTHPPAGQRADGGRGQGRGHRGVMDWDSHRYLECFFAVPMIGAVLHTVNVRLSPEQMLYTMNHAEDRFVLVMSDFLPLVERDPAPDHRQKLSAADRPAAKSADLPEPGRVRAAAVPGEPPVRLPRLRRELGGDAVLHHRHHR